jgi:tyrosyl-tRNA synthetase
MWKYFLLLTDLRGSEVEGLKADVAAGRAHPMEMKKRLAHSIVAGFQGESAASSAGENWARMFQQKAESEDLDELHIAYDDVSGPGDGLPVRLPRLLLALGLASSGAEANRKIAEKAVKVDGETATGTVINVDALPARLVMRLGKRAKIAVLQ